LLTPEAARGFVERVAERAAAAGAPVSLLALLAAVIVVTNTTLVSVTQRMRDIGLRRALGANRRDIMFEVLAEASLIAMVGGAAGLVAARLTLAVAAGAVGFPTALRPGTILLSLAPPD
jgi:putative ABC transport system permease protein